MAVAHAVTQVVEVGERRAGLHVGELDDGVLIQRDASTYAIVVSRQQALQEFVVGSKPLDLHVGMGSEVAHTVRAGNHHQIVLYDMIAALIKHKTALACCAEQVHTGGAQIRRIHRLEASGIPEIYLHRHQGYNFAAQNYTLLFTQTNELCKK